MRNELPPPNLRSLLTDAIAFLGLRPDDFDSDDDYDAAVDELDPTIHSVETETTYRVVLDTEDPYCEVRFTYIDGELHRAEHFTAEGEQIRTVTLSPSERDLLSTYLGVDTRW